MNKNLRYENQIMRVIYISFIIMFFLLLALIISNGTGSMVNMAWGLYVALILLSPIIILGLSKQMQNKLMWKFSFLAITIIMFILSVVIMVLSNPNITLSLKIYGGLFIGLVLIANVLIYYYKTKSTPQEIQKRIDDRNAAATEQEAARVKAVLAEADRLRGASSPPPPPTVESVSPPSYDTAASAPPPPGSSLVTA
jgi:hypothetical protein